MAQRLRERHGRSRRRSGGRAALAVGFWKTPNRQMSCNGRWPITTRANILRRAVLARIHVDRMNALSRLGSLGDHWTVDGHTASQRRGGRSCGFVSDGVSERACPTRTLLAAGGNGRELTHRRKPEGKGKKNEKKVAAMARARQSRMKDGGAFRRLWPLSPDKLGSDSLLFATTAGMLGDSRQSRHWCERASRTGRRTARAAGHRRRRQLGAAPLSGRRRREDSPLARVLR